MTLNDLILKIKLFEGFSTRVYIDAGGTPTIGYGRTDIKSMNETTTKEKEDKWLTEKVSSIYQTVRKKMLGWAYYSLSTDQILALTDFTYNLGIKNLNQLTDNGKRDIPTIADKILLYNKCNGKELKGLTKRRQWEHDLFVQDMHYVKSLVEKESKICTLQVLINSYFSKNNINKKIKVDGIIGKETTQACIDIFNLMKYYFLA